MTRASTHPTRFATGWELGRLPWFDIVDGEIAVVDPTIGPIVDVHAHLALSFVRRDTVDYRAAPRPTEHYLPVDAPLDLELYSNKNFDAAHMKRMKWDLGPQVLYRGGMRATHTVPNLVREMRALGIARSVILPIEIGLPSYNADIYLELAAETPELIPFGTIYPKKKKRDVFAYIEAQKARGARGVKLHPAVQHTRPDHPACEPVYRACADLDLPVLWHCGPVGIEDRWARACSQLKHYWPAVRDNPDTTFILGHTGALQNALAVDLANQYPNVWCELACQSLPAVAYTIEHAPADRLMYGTDWPFYHQSHNIARVLLATDGQEDADAVRRRIFRGNACRLFDLDEDALFAAVGATSPAPKDPSEPE